MEYHTTIASFDKRTGSCRVFEVHEQVVIRKTRRPTPIVSLETRKALRVICEAEVVDFADYCRVLRQVKG